MLLRSVAKNELPPHGDPTRDGVLAEFWKKEPILAGAVYSMSAKMTALSWTVMGKKSLAKYYANLYSRAANMEGYDWGGFISSSAQDFYTTDRGVFWETPRYGPRISGRLADIGHIDALQCAPTGNSKKPLFYLSEVTGQDRFFRPGEFIRFASLPSPREAHLGIGFCASSRAFRAAKLLMGLHNYDEEKLSNLPPEGVAAVSGLTMDEFQDAIAMWKSQRESTNSLTFPQVMWLIGSQPNSTVSIDFTGFSSMPESFDRSTVIDQYVNTLALVFGVDAREFWPVASSSMGSAAESEIQHMKAKGKGPGEFVSIVERKLNGELPEDVEFAFDTQDIAEDKLAAEIAKIWIEAFLPLVTGGAAGGPKMGAPKTGVPFQPAGELPEEQMAEQMKQEVLIDQPPGQFSPQPGQQPGQPGQPPQPGQPLPQQEEKDPYEGGIITVDEFLRLLADRGVLPNYLVKDKRVVVSDSGIAEKHFSNDENVRIRWKEGVLTQERLPPYTVISEQPTAQPIQVNIPNDNHYDTLTWLKQTAEDILEDNRGIRGKPVPAKEALRGNKVTRAAVESELERWRKHPILSKYVPEIDEQGKILENVS
jgi:hypothetical protein